jgi:rubredoxin
MNDVYLYAFLVIAFIIYLRWASKNKSKWGINLTRVTCPVCQTKQPLVRMPGSAEQAMWGGTTCPKCGTKLDKFGNIITG